MRASIFAISGFETWDIRQGEGSMSHTYCCSLHHCVFSTKGRQRTIVPEIQERLWAYMGGIARENEMKALAVGGTDDHAHLLLSLPASLSIAEAMRKIKAGSSRWLHVSCGLKGVCVAGGVWRLQRWMVTG
jgi:REP element-mobilizing transposase RayT